MRQASVDDLEAFVAAAVQTQCRLRELLMSIVPTGDTDQRVRVFFDALCDPNHPLAENLRQLDLGLYVETETAKEIFEPILRMIRLNRRLVGVHLRIELPGRARALLPDFMEAFDGLSNEIVSIRTAPLGICNKLAFLSVVDQVARDRGSSAVGGLDTSILSMVFQYAAEGRARSVTVMYGEPLGGDEEDQEGEEEDEE